MQSPDPQTTRGNGNLASDEREPRSPEYRVPTHYASNTGSYVAIGAAVMGLVLLVGFFVVFHIKSKAAATLREQTARDASAPPMVDVVSVKPAPTTQPLSLPGETQAWYESTIYARVSGYVAKWLVDIGDKVKGPAGDKPGQVLATIDTPELDAQLEAADAKLNAAEAQVGVEQANADFAKTTYERWKGAKPGEVSEQEVAEKKAAFDSSVAKLKAAAAQVSLNQAEVNSLRALTRFKEVTAPYDGVITSRRVDIGDLVTAGSTASTTSLYNIAQSDTMRVFVDVPQGASGDISVGVPVVVRTTQFRDRKFQGSVTRTANSIDPASRTLHVEADIPNPGLTLVPGMYVQVSFELVQKSLLQVPASALLFRSTGAQVAVVGPDGKVSFRKVAIARDQGDYVEIGSGLSPGDKVALNISSEIDDGDKVTVNDLDAPAAKSNAAPATPVTSAGSAQ